MAEPRHARRPEGSGKSHLAAIWAEHAGARSTAARALTAGAVPGALATGALVIEDLKPGMSTNVRCFI